jgi:hypothetical protein|tara:strand:- start:2650 stop:2766 length:117 start_codon:yes stop_codon:yes gene_type:complete
MEWLNSFTGLAINASSFAAGDRAKTAQKIIEVGVNRRG